MQFYLKIFLLSFLLFIYKAGHTQQYISGTVYDSSGINLIPGVRVTNMEGLFVFTDSLGKYTLQVNDKDSITFIYRDKPTKKFAVKTIADPSQFNISLRVNYKSKYTTLQKVVVYSKSYKQDSIENRATYANIFNFEKPGIETGIGANGVPGIDINEFINIFRFKRNKQIRSLQKRLETEEQEKYINYRFNKTFVKRITHLDDALLDNFLILYRPPYEFVSTASEVEFNQYILDASYDYKINLLKQQEKKE